MEQVEIQIVLCDSCEARDTITVDVRDDPTRIIVWNAFDLWRAGWRIINGKFYCPDCLDQPDIFEDDQ